MPEVAGRSPPRYAAAGHGLRPENGRSRHAAAVRTFKHARRRAISACAASRTRPACRSAFCPNGCVFAIEHRHERGRTMINQVLGSPLDGGIGRLYLRIRAPEPADRRGGRARREGRLRRRRRPLRLGRRNRRRAAPRRRSGCTRSSNALAVAPRGREHARGRGDVRRDPRAGRRPRRARLPHEQRGLRLAVHRPPRRRAPGLRAGGDEPAEPGAGRRPSLGRAWLPRRRRQLRHRRDAAVRARRIGTPPRSIPEPICPASGCSTRSPAR